MKALFSYHLYLNLFTSLNRYAKLPILSYSNVVAEFFPFIKNSNILLVISGTNPHLRNEKVKS